MESFGDFYLQVLFRFLRNESQHISNLGGNWRNGLNCGMFNRNLNNAPSTSNGNVASR